MVGMGMSRSNQLAVLGAVGIIPTLVAYTLLRSWHTLLSLMFTALVSLVGYRWTLYIIPKLEPRHVRAGLVGKDINKKGTEAGERPVPESLGLAPGVVCLACLAVIQLIHTGRVVPRLCALLQLGDCEDIDSAAWMDDFPAAIASIALMLMLGFVDDVLDLPWRVKLVMPLVAALPLLAAYTGSTAVAIPSPIVNYLNLQQTWLELGPLYYVYMTMLVIFCTNSINILAGVNGLEVGQSYIISVAILTFNILRLTWSTGSALSSSALFSAYVMMPTAATSFALLSYNWYPSRVFVGDTYTYFAGMTIAVAGILGHFSQTLLIFLIPQVVNFVYSIPQLFGIVFCPRHRLPTFDPKTALLTATPNWNLVNLFLQIGGRCTELWLCVRILTVQVMCCMLGLALNELLRGVWKQ
eukprot:jgi/Ulvmu1/1378/UM011_0106.1